MPNHNALLVLNAIPGLSNRNIIALVNHFGSAKKTLKASVEDLVATGIITNLIAERIAQFPRDEFLESELAAIQKAHIDVITYEDADYPQQLAEIADSPVVLYKKGNWPQNLDASIAIVGSRMASIYGRKVAKSLARQLVQYGIPVISGLAKGIDAAAHAGAIENQGQTVAVLGCGLMHIYPSENKTLYELIPQNGVIISEFPMHMRPTPYNFPRRNRIVSGLSRGVVVVEAAKKSGALITADFALEQGRDVYAVPGNIDAVGAGGTNHLIAQGAKIVSNANDILEDLKAYLPQALQGYSPIIPSETQKNILKNLTDEEKIVYNQITADPKHIDELIVHLQDHHVMHAGSILLKLEMRKLIEQLPGQWFRRPMIKS